MDDLALIALRDELIEEPLEDESDDELSSSVVLLNSLLFADERLFLFGWLSFTSDSFFSSDFSPSSFSLSVLDTALFDCCRCSSFSCWTAFL